jgi:hypothetical protein
MLLRRWPSALAYRLARFLNGGSLTLKHPRPVKQKLRRAETTIDREYNEIIDAERKAEAIQKIQQFELASNGIFEVFVVDPPWKYPVANRDSAPQYPTMTIDEIIELNLHPLSYSAQPKRCQTAKRRGLTSGP